MHMSLIPMQNQKRQPQDENDTTEQKRQRTKKLGKRNFDQQRQQKRGFNEDTDSKYK